MGSRDIHWSWWKLEKLSERGVVGWWCNFGSFTANWRCRWSHEECHDRASSLWSVPSPIFPTSLPIHPSIRPFVSTFFFGSSNKIKLILHEMPKKSARKRKNFCVSRSPLPSFRYSFLTTRTMSWKVDTTIKQKWKRATRKKKSRNHPISISANSWFAFCLIEYKCATRCFGSVAVVAFLHQFNYLNFPRALKQFEKFPGHLQRPTIGAWWLAGCRNMATLGISSLLTCTFSRAVVKIHTAIIGRLCWFDQLTFPPWGLALLAAQWAAPSSDYMFVD